MRHFFLSILFVLALPISAQQWYFSVDEYCAAERPLLKDSRQVLLVNNTVPQPEDFGHSIAVDGVPRENDRVALDQAPLHCLFTATQSMDESMEYERVELLEISQNSSADFYHRNQLSRSQMQALCEEYEVQALLILNQLVLYNILESFPSDDMYYAYLQACSQSHWTVYRRGGHLDVFTTSDTILWESELSYTRQQALRQLPSTDDALMYLAREVGEKVATSLTPQWQPAKRYLYDTKNPAIQAGLQSFRFQHWDDAIAAWLPCINGMDKKAAPMAAANIAIAYEMLGDYASACDYAQRSIRLFGAWKTAYARQQQANIRYYLAQLQARQAKPHGQ